MSVALSGDGGDELFYGYERYPTAERIVRQIGRLPRRTRRILSGFVAVAPAEVLDRLSRLLPRRLRIERLADRLPMLADVLPQGSLESHALQPDRLVPGARQPTALLGHTGTIRGLPRLRE